MEATVIFCRGKGGERNAAALPKLFCGLTPSLSLLFHDSRSGLFGYSHGDSGGGGGGIIKCKLRLYEYAKRRGRRDEEERGEEGEALEGTIEGGAGSQDGRGRFAAAKVERDSQ